MAAVHLGTQSVFDRQGNEVFEGQWDPRTLAEILSGDQPQFWKGKRVLDIGANTGGLSIELARLGASVTAAEPDPYRNTMALAEHALTEIRRDEALDITVEPVDLFSSHSLPRHDVVLCLGLIYHFRYPQLTIDYLSSLRPDVLFISCQTHPSDDLALYNRAHPGILPKGHLPDDNVLTGWHPTRPLLERMLAWAGFTNVQSLTPERYDFPKTREGATNSAYYRADLAEAVDLEAVRVAFYPR
jgi:SAM-dependent methyltransferase